MTAERRRGRPGRLLALLLLSALFVSACTVDPTSGSFEPSGEYTGPPEKPYRIAMITHGDEGGFWSVVRRGATDAAEALDVTLDYQSADGDFQLQSQMIDAAILAGAQGLAISAADVGAISSNLRAAISAGIPVVTLNSGAELATQMDGVITHVGQSEELAGERAGERLADDGYSKMLCVIHEQNNVGLQERCRGAATGFGDGETIRVQVTGKADPVSTAREIGAVISAQDPDVVLTLDPDIAAAALPQTKSADVPLATFDLSADVLKAILNDEVLFAVDQQQYLQGYLPVTFLELAIRNGNEVGSGDLVLTGPSFITKDNAEEVLVLGEQGTR